MNTSVLAAQEIPEGISSLPGVGNINMLRLLEKSTVTIYYHVEVRNGTLSILEKEAGQSWACFINVARNCQEQNVELLRSYGVLILRTTRTIKSSEELFVWIGSDLILELEYPFLKPFNIKGNQNYFCHKCGKVFQNPNPLKVHLSLQCATLHLEYPISSLQVKHPSYGSCHKETFSPASRGHVCPYCGKVYSRKYGLKIHVRTHTGYKPLKCKFCLRPFSDPSNLNKHVRLHSDSPYRCLICGKVLVRRRDLQRHLKSRHHSLKDATK